ncbi:FAD-binding oxidoreductase [Aquidulcibacter paucihalophilus]|uniref:FAD-binding oxidoreductase n=1 Tax=Aquidulcibacter paucihalophilus TaxID=1978549 RepID=UPI000A196978|nr:FAD-linked oxidase C-terminal domain-containing protein [Aquidulcibacter paucihalophilus]
MTNHSHLADRLADRFGSRLITSTAALEHYAQSEGPHEYRPPDLVAQPLTVEEVQCLVVTAAEASYAVVGFGAGTSLEGNAASIRPRTLCVDFSRMDNIKAIRSSDLIATVEPGVTREALNLSLKDTGLFFPVDPGANATIGGMIATRASGTTTVQYGSMSDNVLALKVVMADGRLVSTGTLARKSASGYDLTHLFTGSEGTLGLIVEASLRLHGQPESFVSATWDFETIEGAVETVMSTIQASIPIARMELLDEAAIRACNHQSKLGLVERATLFLEFHGTPNSIAERLELVTAIGMDCGGGQLKTARATEERNLLWRARHHALWAARSMIPGSRAWITDICVPISELGSAINLAKSKITEAGLFAPILGHVGDGNFHVFFILPPGDKESWAKAHLVNEAMISHALSVGGTCTGEHGIGLGKRKALLREHGEESISVMKTIKTALDPRNILNPGKIFV